VLLKQKSLVGGFRMIERKQTENMTTRCCDTKKTDFEKNHLESERTFFSALYLCKTPCSLLSPQKICNPSASIYSSLNSIIMTTTTKTNLDLASAFTSARCLKNACVLSVPKKKLNNEISPDF